MIAFMRGMITLLLMLLFIGLIVWAWSGRRRDVFAQMARLPLDEAATPVDEPTDESRGRKP